MLNTMLGYYVFMSKIPCFYLQTTVLLMPESHIWNTRTIGFHRDNTILSSRLRYIFVEM